MLMAVELAGSFAAHAVWSLSEGDGFIPMLAYAGEDGQRHMERLAFDDTRLAVEHGRKKLAANPMDASDAVLLFDGHIPNGDKKLDAIIIELRSYAFPNAAAMIAVPYAPASTGRFVIHRPELLQWENCEDFDTGAALDCFFSGVESHEIGEEVWKRCIAAG